LSDVNQPLKDIRSTGDEAQRWLELLDSESTPQAKEPQAAQAEPDSETSQKSAPASDQTHPALVLLILAILFSPLILLAVNQSGRGGRSSSSSSRAALAYKPSCGSTTSASGYWWPVLGGTDRSLLLTVRNQYCGDAFINAEGFLQVASFGSWKEADMFRSRIEQATGKSFRVGESSLPVQ
jgi:hypothetical protein